MVDNISASVDYGAENGKIQRNWSDVYTGEVIIFWDNQPRYIAM